MSNKPKLKPSAQITRLCDKKPDLFETFDNAVTLMSDYRESPEKCMDVAKALLGFCGKVLETKYTNAVGIWTLESLDKLWQIFVKAYELSHEYRFENNLLGEDCSEAIPSKYWVRELVLQCEKNCKKVNMNAVNLGWGINPDVYRNPDKYGRSNIVFDVYANDGIHIEEEDK